MDIPFTLITTGILALIFFGHSLRIISGRKTTKTNLGDGGNDLMVRRIRIHGNFAEYVPLLLLILFLLESQDVVPWALGSFAVTVVLGRCLHAYGLFSSQTPGWARIAGMQLTLWPLAVGGAYLIALGLL